MLFSSSLDNQTRELEAEAKWRRKREARRYLSSVMLNLANEFEAANREQICAICIQ